MATFVNHKVYHKSIEEKLERRGTEKSRIGI